MNNLNLRPTFLTMPPATNPLPQAGRCLFVLVPGLEVDLANSTRRVWELAKSTGAHIHFLGLYSDPSQEPGLRRELVTMSAMVKDGGFSAEVDVIFGTNWVDVVLTRVTPGDMVVCFAEHRVGMSSRPLSQVLQSGLNVPLYVLTDLYPRNDARSNWLSQIAVWTGSIGIILGFFWLQVRIDQASGNWVGTAMLMLSIVVEIILVWIWNSLFG